MAERGFPGSFFGFFFFLHTEDHFVAFGDRIFFFFFSSGGQIEHLREGCLRYWSIKGRVILVVKLLGGKAVAEND